MPQVALTWLHDQPAVASVILDRFTGYGADGQPMLQVLGADSSYWIVWTWEDQTLERVGVAFPQDAPYFEPTPEPLWIDGRCRYRRRRGAVEGA